MGLIDNNYWDNLMETDERAATYMFTYGEGPGCETRHTIGSFINDTETVLDIGCGPGWNYDHFRDFGPDILDYRGYDLSPRFVRVANKRIIDSGQKMPLIYVGDCRHIEEPDGSWDVVLLQDILEHTNGYEEPVREALRVAKRRLIISFWHMKLDTQTQINDDTDKGTNGYGAWYNKADWEEFLDSLGYFWLDTESTSKANRYHLFYVIDKQTALEYV